MEDILFICCNYLNLLPGSLTLQNQTAPSRKRYRQLIMKTILVLLFIFTSCSDPNSNPVVTDLGKIHSNDNDTVFNKNKIEIRDNGAGFPQDILKKINQEETMVSTKEDGSGIGTAIIKDLVKNMDGKVSFYNDKGAVVLINL